MYAQKWTIRQQINEAESIEALNLYAQKWTYRASVNAAETVDELNAITFKFDMLDFSE